ncbi:MAG: CPBP family intramembrane metalloprotease [Candidatus Marinimicrobia bacterium]|nr:CPBP family intramembrane metalloprotease [Candidatus Neomarinimicrobiota bacterium]
MIIPTILKLLVLSPIFSIFPIELEQSKAIQAIFSVIIILFTYKYFFKWLDQRYISEISSEGMLRELINGFSLGFIMIGVIIAILSISGYYTGGWVNPPYSTLKPFLIFSVMGVLEEVIFRGILYRITEKHLGTIWALIISSLIFGFVHMSNENFNSFSGIAIALELGLLTGIAFTLSGRLWLPIAIHVGWNYSLIFFGAIVSGASEYDLIIESEISGPVWATGGAFGPENSLITIGVSLLVFAGLYIKPRDF